MKKWLITLIGFTGMLLGLNSSLFAQNQNETNKKNTISLEAGGAGGYYSLNYSRLFYSKDKTTIHARLGFSMMPVTLYNDEKPVTIIPVGVIGYYGSNHHFLKLGITTTFFWGYEYLNPGDEDYEKGCTQCPNYVRKFHFTIFPEVGYEFRFLNHFRSGISFSPLVFDNGFTYTSWGSINLGYRF